MLAAGPCDCFLEVHSIVFQHLFGGVDSEKKCRYAGELMRSRRQIVLLSEVLFFVHLKMIVQ